MKTAVEWLYERLERMIPRTALYNIDKEDYFKHAQEMEREQIKDAHYDGKGNGINISHSLSRTKEISADEYYNETFKSE